MKMYIYVPSCLLIVCGIVNAIIYEPDIINQLKARRQKPVGLPYPYEYNYNSIEPSDNFYQQEPLDTRNNAYPPPHWIFKNIKPVLHDVPSVPKSFPYQKIDSNYAPTFDSDEYDSLKMPHRLTPDNHYNTFLDSVSDKYHQQSRIFKRSSNFQRLDTPFPMIFRDLKPTYQLNYPVYTESLDVVVNVPTTIFEEIPSFSRAPEIYNTPLTLIFVALSPPIHTSTKDENSAEGKSNFLPTEPVQITDESNYMSGSEMFTSTTENKLDSVTTEESLNEEESMYNTTTEKLNTTTEDDHNMSIVMDLIENELNSTTTSKILTTTEEEESNDLPSDGSIMKVEDSILESTREEDQSADDSNSVFTKEEPTVNESSYKTTLEKFLTSDEYNKYPSTLTLVDILESNDKHRFDDEEDLQEIFL